MSYFPQEVMPKQLAKETIEVPGAPDIFNAQDYNSHEREIIAIERFLLGTGWSGFQAWSGFSGYSASSSTDVTPAIDPLTALNDSLSGLANANQVTNMTGLMPNGTAMPIPSGLFHTVTTGTTLAADTSISVSSTANFAQSGFVTKINSLPSVPSTVGGNMAQVYSIYGGKMTFQEVIQYSSTTPTSFEGCTRGVFGTTQQDSPAGNIIIAGEASIMFTPMFWEPKDGLLVPMDTLLIEQTDGLAATLRTFAGATPSSLGEQDIISRLGYSLIFKNQIIPSGGS